jgi:2-polyprenyl-6-methoxyphenol hydroxylase-like FAD-dependent oxidoreductase
MRRPVTALAACLSSCKFTAPIAVDVAVVERRANHDLDGARARGLLSRTIEVLDQRGVAKRFLSEGQVAQIGSFAGSRWTSATSPHGHNYGLALLRKHVERLLAGCIGELATPVLTRPDRHVAWVGQSGGRAGLHEAPITWSELRSKRIEA